MRVLPLLSLIGLLALGGCSDTFDVRAVMTDGRLTFVADGPSRGRARCVSHVAVMVAEASPSSGHGPYEAWRQRAYAWVDQGGYGCDDRFPIVYGQALKGEDVRSSGPTFEDVAPKALEVGRVYIVMVTVDATGYGGGSFRLLPDGTVENLGPAVLIGEDGPA